MKSTAAYGGLRRRLGALQLATVCIVCSAQWPIAVETQTNPVCGLFESVRTGTLQLRFATVWSYNLKFWKLKALFCVNRSMVFSSLCNAKR